MSTTPGKQSDLNGSVPDNHHTALLLIDVINHFEFPGGKELYEKAFPIGPRIAALKRRAQSAGVPVIYVNDNFGKWRSHFPALVDYCTSPSATGRDFVEQLTPGPEDYFVLKPKHSAFYQTPLDILLKSLGTKRLILTGVTTNSCVLFTAQDAYMRDLELVIPPDCVAACSAYEQEYSLRQFQTVVKADTSLSAEVSFELENAQPQVYTS